MSVKPECHKCGRTIKTRSPTNQVRRRHKCPHGEWCIGGDPKLYIYGHGWCKRCWDAAKESGRGFGHENKTHEGG